MYKKITFFICATLIVSNLNGCSLNDYTYALLGTKNSDFEFGKVSIDNAKYQSIENGMHVIPVNHGLRNFVFINKNNKEITLQLEAVRGENTLVYNNQQSVWLWNGKAVERK